jgi:DNA polymerase
VKKTDYEEYSQLFPDKANSLRLVEHCTLCSQRGHSFVGTDLIWGNGPVPADLMVVAKDSAGGSPLESLWRGSRCTGIPLTNKKSGAKLRILLWKAEIDPRTVFMTNTVKCNTGYDKCGLRYRTLARICSQHLREEIDRVRPRVIIALGVDAATQVTDLWDKPEPCDSPYLDGREMITLGGRLPFRIPTPRTTDRTNGFTGILVFGMKHPSYVEGPRETIYTENLCRIREFMQQTMA